MRWGFSELFPKSCALKSIQRRDEHKIFTIVYGESLGTLEYFNLSATTTVLLLSD